MRANGQIASGKQQPLPRAPVVPPVEAVQVQEGLELLRQAVAEKGAPEASSAEWQAAYEMAQDRLHARYPRMQADAILWRATFLDALIGWSGFKEFHREDGELPTPDMLEVAATIPTRGSDESFDMELFEKRLVERSG